MLRCSTHGVERGERRASAGGGSGTATDARRCGTIFTARRSGTTIDPSGLRAGTSPLARLTRSGSRRLRCGGRAVSCACMQRAVGPVLRQSSERPTKRITGGKPVSLRRSTRSWSPWKCTECGASSEQRDAHDIGGKAPSMIRSAFSAPDAYVRRRATTSDHPAVTPSSNRFMFGSEQTSSPPPEFRRDSPEQPITVRCPQYSRDRRKKTSRDRNSFPSATVKFRFATGERTRSSRRHN
jgi:hypothetical protein